MILTELVMVGPGRLMVLVLALKFSHTSYKLYFAVHVASAN